MAQPATDEVAGDRVAHRLRYHEPGPLRCSLTPLSCRVDMHHETVAGSPPTPPDHGREVARPP
jgi:hypothetical protein